MKTSRKSLILLGCFILFFCTACTDKQPVSENNNKEKIVKEKTEVEEQTEPKEETRKPEQSVEKNPEEVKPIQLNNTYETKYGDVNAVTYPKFYFDYPNNWQISAEEVSTTNERVVLSNERGATVTFSHIGGVAEGQLGGGSAVTMRRVDISKASDSQFIPGYVQATDHSELGKFMVAKLKVTGQLNMQTDSDFQNVDGAVAYAVIPESWVGTRDDVRGVYAGEFAFYYSGYISFIAESPSEQFTSDEEREIIEILSSFRNEY